MAQSQFALLRQRRFLPYFLVQGLGAFNDNVFRQAIIGLPWPRKAAGLRVSVSMGGSLRRRVGRRP